MYVYIRPFFYHNYTFITKDGNKPCYSYLYVKYVKSRYISESILKDN